MIYRELLPSSSLMLVPWVSNRRFDQKSEAGRTSIESRARSLLEEEKVAVPGGRRAVGLAAEISHNVSESCKPSFQLGTIIEPLALRLVQ